MTSTDPLHRGSADRLAAVHDEGVADGEGAEVGGQPEHGRGDLLGAAHPADRLLADDLVVVSAGEVIPGDGDVIEGIASVDE